jgi:hypothetical protein
MDKKLEIGKNYGDIFGLDPKKGMRMIYLGGNKWRCEKPGAVKEIEGESTTLGSQKNKEEKCRVRAQTKGGWRKESQNVLPIKFKMSF